MTEKEERRKEMREERLRIEKMPSTQLIATFEDSIRNGAGVLFTPLMWYREEILKRCLLSGVEEEE